MIVRNVQHVVVAGGVRLCHCVIVGRRCRTFNDNGQERLTGTILIGQVLLLVLRVVVGDHFLTI